MGVDDAFGDVEPQGRFFLRHRRAEPLELLQNVFAGIQVTRASPPAAIVEGVYCTWENWEGGES